MLTNPSTLGLFDENIEEITRIFHDAGALMYYDGANLNAVCGISRPGDMGFDIVHFNLHKTFSQPHGGGGPGGGPIAVRDRLEPFLPVPAVVRDGERFRYDYDRPQTIGKVRGFAGPFGVFVRSYAYIRSYGPRLREMSEVAVLNANYLLAQLKDAYELPFDRLCMHEFVLSARTLKREHGITALDVAKRLMDYDFHPPTIYFPLIVPEALMIEPTETEAKETLDEFVEAMLEIVRDASERPEVLKEAPHDRPVGRVDEVKAAKRAVVRYLFEDHPDLSADSSEARQLEAQKGRLEQVDVDFGLGQPAVALTLAAEPPVGDPDEDEADQQSHVRPREGEPEHDDRGIRCPAEETVFLEQAPQGDGKFHAPSIRVAVAHMIGAPVENVYPLCEGQR